MFNHLTKKEIKGTNGSFEVFDKKTGELIGAIFRDEKTPEQIEAGDFHSPYEVYYKGQFICNEKVSPAALKVISDLQKDEIKKLKGG